MNFVFVDVPVFFEAGLFQCFCQGGITDIAVGLLHRGAVFDVALGIDGDFAVEAGVVIHTLPDMFQIIGKQGRMDTTTIRFVYYIFLRDKNPLADSGPTG